MKMLAWVALAVAVALPVWTQESNYSQEQLDRTFAMRQIDLPERPEGRVRYGLGYVDFRALGIDWRLIYLPIAMPLSGTRMGTTNEWPDPFALTSTAVATTPRTWHTQRHVNREIRRIKKSEKSGLIVRKQ
jgi:hypothetical protein